MVHDYYAILGTATSADLATLRTAYLARARELHPDRGGSHVQMILLNKAWEVLSNSESRRLYDLSRTGHATFAEQERFEEEVAAAEAKAADYPLDWASFEQWVQSITQDFTQSDARQSRSLHLFVGIGILSGWLLGVLWATQLTFPGSGRASLASFAVVTAVPSAAGAFCGLLLHHLIASGFHLSGVGINGRGMRLTEAERWGLIFAAGVGAFALVAITDRTSFRTPYELGIDQAARAWVDALFVRISQGAVRGFLIGAILCWLSTSLVRKRIESDSGPSRLEEAFAFHAGLYGGGAFAIMGACCAYWTFSDSAATLEVRRMLLGGTFGAIAFGLALVALKKSYLEHATEKGMPAADDSFVIPCPQCRRNLRLPKSVEKLTVTCPECRHRFDQCTANPGARSTT